MAEYQPDSISDGFTDCVCTVCSNVSTELVPGVTESGTCCVVSTWELINDSRSLALINVNRSEMKQWKHYSVLKAFIMYINVIVIKYKHRPIRKVHILISSQNGTKAEIPYMQYMQIHMHHCGILAFSETPHILTYFPWESLPG